MPDTGEPFVIGVLSYTLTKTKLGNAAFTSRAVQNEPDLLIRGILLAGRPLDVFDDLLTRTFACSSCQSLIKLLELDPWALTPDTVRKPSLSAF